MKKLLAILILASLSIVLALTACLTGDDDDDNNDNDSASLVSCTDGTCCWTDCTDGAEVCGPSNSQVCELPAWVAEAGCVVTDEYQDDDYNEVSLACPCPSPDGTMITSENYHIGPQCENVAADNPIDCDFDFESICQSSADDDDDITDDDDDVTWEVCEEGTYQCSSTDWYIQKCENDAWVDTLNCHNYEGRHGDSCHCGHTGDDYYCNFGEEICYEFSE